MRLFFAIVVSAAALLATDPQTEKQTQKKTTPPKVTDGSKPLPIPAGATKTADGDYHYTDPEGKKWIYHKTPFGVAKLEEKDAAAEEKTPLSVSAAGIKATEAGDIVKFERLGPFGVWKWEKKKSELTEVEKFALQNSRSENTSKQQ